MEKGIKLIIFDYSGTLSPAMADFAKPDNLIRHLKASGLAALGIDDTLFWQIVNADWGECGSKRKEYEKVIYEGVSAIVPAANKNKLQSAAHNFAQAYFQNSFIANNWRPVLQKLSGDKSVFVVIATDNYTEATPAIIDNLAKWNIQASPVKIKSRCNILAANSADIGAVKNDNKFWQAVRGALPSNCEKILLIDDFGQNEQVADAYRYRKNIEKRSKEIVKILQSVFAIDVETVPFVPSEQGFACGIAEIAQIINRFVSQVSQ